MIVLDHSHGSCGRVYDRVKTPALCLAAARRYATVQERCNNMANKTDCNMDLAAHAVYSALVPAVTLAFVYWPLKDPGCLFGPDLSNLSKHIPNRPALVAYYNLDQVCVATCLMRQCRCKPLHSLYLIKRDALPRFQLKSVF